MCYSLTGNLGLLAFDCFHKVCRKSFISRFFGFRKVKYTCHTYISLLFMLILLDKVPILEVQTTSTTLLKCLALRRHIRQPTLLKDLPLPVIIPRENRIRILAPNILNLLIPMVPRVASQVTLCRPSMELYEELEVTDSSLGFVYQGSCVHPPVLVDLFSAGLDVQVWLLDWTDVPFRIEDLFSMHIESFSRNFVDFRLRAIVVLDV